MFVHICPAKGTAVPTSVSMPMAKKPKAVTDFLSGKRVAHNYRHGQLTIELPNKLATPDHVIIIKN